MHALQMTHRAIPIDSDVSVVIIIDIEADIQAEPAKSELSNLAGIP